MARSTRFYRQALAAARREQEALRRRREHIDLRLARLERTIAGLEALFEPARRRELGLTDACRHLLKGAAGPLSAGQVRDELVRNGHPSVAASRNPLASVHTVLKRLAKSGEAVVVPAAASGERAYWWAANPPPWRHALPARRPVTVKVVRGPEELRRLIDDFGKGGEGEG
jgi:hypothetical protein